MGKKLEIAPFTTASVGFPVKEGTWDFLQLAYQERISAAIQSIIGIEYDATKVYIMFGCIATVVGGSTNFTSGALFFNGDVYLFDAQSVVTPTGPNIFVVNSTRTQYTINADPVAFVGGSSENVHNIYKATIGTGLTGTGSLSGDGNSDFANVFGYGKWVNAPSLNVVVPSGTGIVTATGYNKFLLSGNTLNWQFFVSITITGTPSTCSLIMSSNPFGGLKVTNTNNIVPFFHQLGFSSQDLALGLIANSSDLPEIIMSPIGGGNFAAGLNNFWINITAEIG